MTAIGLYFRGMNKDETNATRRKFAAIAKRHGYVCVKGSPRPKEGNPAAIIVGIVRGEMALVLLPDPQRQWVAEWLREQALVIHDQADDFRALDIAEALGTIAEALEDAMGRSG